MRGISGTFAEVRIRVAASIALALCSPFLFEGCREERLQGLEAVQYAPTVDSFVQLNFCTDPADFVKSKLKYVIVHDHSGSNQRNFRLAADGSGAPAVPVELSAAFGTDPLGNFRFGDVAAEGTLLNYLSQLPPNDPADPSRYFALVNFDSSVETYPSVSATDLNNAQTNYPGFTSDIPAFYQRVTAEKRNLGDDGATNYKGALDTVQKLIRNDINQARRCAAMSVGSSSPGRWCPKPGKQVSSTYVVVFISDGSPIERIDGVGQDASGNIVVTGPINVVKQSSREILALVAGIAGLQADTRFVDGINLFTVYYYVQGNVDTSARALLGDMATVGNGVFYDLVSGSNLDYTRFIPPSKLIKFTLADVFVTNSSVDFWPDGKAYADRDMDGLPDEVEATLGSDPLNPDSDGNGVNDLVEYRLNDEKPCNSRNASDLCQRTGALNFAGATCTGIKTSPLAPPTGARPVTGAITFTQSDPSGLNDCEKAVLNDMGGINNPDSNGDAIPDWLQFRNGSPFRIGARMAQEPSDLDGVSDYQKIKTSLPVLYPLTGLLYPQPSRYDLTLLSTSETQDCYRLRVRDLPIMGDNNAVRVDVIERSMLLQDRFLYRTTTRRLGSASQALTIEDWNNPDEKRLKTWRAWP